MSGEAGKTIDDSSSSTSGSLALRTPSSTSPAAVSVSISNPMHEATVDAAAAPAAAVAPASTSTTSTSTSTKADGPIPTISSATTKAGEAAAAATANSSAAKGPPPVPFSKLYRYASKTDLTYLTIAILCAMLSGVAMPLFSIFFGDLLNALNAANPAEAVNKVCAELGGLALGVGLSAYLSASLSAVAAVKQVSRLRSAYVSALLRQDAEYNDTHKSGEAASRLAADTVTISGGIGDKAMTIVTSVTTFFAGFVIAFVRGWKMSLVILAFLPVIAIVGGILNKYIATGEGRNSSAFGAAGAAASEALSTIRTVAAFGGEKAEVRRFDGHLAVSEKANIKKGWITGAAIGVLLLNIFCVYGIGLYFGGRLVVWSREEHPICATVFAADYDYCFTGGNVLQVIFALLIGASSLGQAGPAVAAVSSARGAAASMYEVIDRVPSIDVDNAGGEAPAHPAKGTISFEKVTFAYPSRPDQPILRNFSLTIEAGTTVALVGSSGSGKSTVIALLSRLYDVQEGKVTLDDRDIRDYNVAWLRSQLALVAQEPQLFATTLHDNIAMGKPGAVAATEEEVKKAAKAANAHDFIMSLPEGYQSRVTSLTLSGGQKQRVAIARAIVRGAPILLSDEATSALDSEQERQVQRQIDKLLAGTDGRKQTAIVIAHRLSTVTRADRIIVMEKGEVVESGSHAELMANPDSRYRLLREMQRVGDGDGDETEEETELPEKVDVTADGKKSAPPSPQLKSSSSLSGAAAAAAKAQLEADGGKKKTAAGEVDEDGKTTKKEEEASDGPAVPLSRILSYHAPEKWWIALGLLCSAANGVQFPAFSILLSRFLSIYYEPDSDLLLLNTLYYLGYLILIGVGALFANIGASYSWHLVSERMLRRMRRDAFRGLLKSEVAWFDLPENSVGRLTSLLASESELLKQAIGMNMGMNVQNICGLVCGLIIAFIASWQMTLVIISVSPVVMIGGFLQVKFFLSADKEAQTAFADCAQVITEAMSVPRLVAAFGLEGRVRASFARELVKPTKAASKGALSLGIGPGLGNLSMIGIYALAFWVGSRFIDLGYITFQELMQSFFAVVFAAMGLGQASAMGADSAKANKARRALFAMMDRISAVDPLAESGVKQGEKGVPPITGKIEFKDIHFAYPTRPEAEVLKGLSLTIEPGQTAAICGPSGSGKSTIFQLLLRFYNPSSGQVVVDGHPISEWNVASLRQAMGWVQQEAPLFADSIAYNIAYGTAVDEQKPIPGLGVAPDAGMEGKPSADFTVSPAVLSAAASANAKTFIDSFHNGFATFAGERGSQVSGGQKQRIAIARALLREPALLLFDEATAALDSESERTVQAAIDALVLAAKEADAKKAASRTILLIAHRLSTIRHADVIFVVDKGVVVEKGSHEALVAAGGLYARMVTAQDAGLGGRRHSAVGVAAPAAAVAAV